MKKHIIRRAGALVLALALALTLTVPAWAAVTDIKLDQDSLNLTVGDIATLKATVTAEPEDNTTVTWSTSNSTVASVNQDGRVTALSKGETIITATADGQSATCTVTVNNPPVDDITISGSTIDPTWLSANFNPPNADPLEGSYTWTIEAYDPDELGMTAPKFKGGVTDEDGNSTLTGSAATAELVYTQANAGQYTVKVTFTPDGGGKSYEAEMLVTISGILLKPSRGQEDDGIVKMFLNDSITLSVWTYGSAKNSNNVLWTSSDGSILAVMGGTVTSYNKLGKALVTAIKGNYSAECMVEVVEDTSVVASGYTASVSKPLNIGEVVYKRLNQICEEKTAERSETNPPTSSPLRYINNLKVSTSQGTLYYNYVAEGDTGYGVGIADQFAKSTGGTTYYSIDRLYFVPKAGFIGEAEITFQGVAVNGYNFSGTIKVNVGMGSAGEDGEDNKDNGYAYQISYRARAGEPAWFMTSDFNSFCKSVTGRSFNSVTFSLPRSSEGVLYYNYAGGTGTPVTTATKFTPAGVYTLDNVCFVPNAAYASEDKPVEISFQVVDSSGETKIGVLEVYVIPADVAGDPSNVSVSGEKGQPITLQAELFNDACRDTIKDTLSFVVFKLPNPSDGVLYYNYKSEGSYESRITASTRCYYSGVPGLSGVTFVPSSSATGRIAIPYTGYGSTGTSYSGTLYINLDEVNSSTIRYSVEKNGSVTFKASDFYNAGLYQKGVGVNYVTFTDVPRTLYYDYRSSNSYHPTASSGTRYYVSPNSWQSGLNLLSFHAVGVTGTVTIPYKAYDSKDQWLFDGNVVIQVGTIAAADINTSCNTGRPLGLSSHSLGIACDPVMSKSMSYIEITSVPTPKEGRLYLNYSGFGTGIAVKPGDRFYRVGSPGIDRLTFVPHAGFTGEAEITYIGYIDNGSEQASGRIKVNVSQSTTSLYFNDMGRYVWAIDSVDYLYQNRTVEGVGGGRYNPAGTITKGDFTLMLVRAYGLTANGSASFKDVPANSYYADAIRIAALLGIAGGSNGYYNPKAALSRQDAMVMIFNTLKASGKIVTNGLAADLSIFYDEDDIAPYAKEAVGSLVQMGVVEGNGNGYLRPRNLLNRAETAKLLHAIMTL